MADQEHLQTLQQGVEAWNLWRTQHPDVRPILTHAYLRNDDFRKADLFNADLRKADLFNADFRYVNLRYADLSNANLFNADLSNADLRYANLGKADLSNADLSNANLFNADLSNTDLRYANLSNANLRYTDLSNANLFNANLFNADLNGANFQKAKLSKGTLIKIETASKADFSQLALNRVVFRRLNLQQADFSGASLIGADFSDAHLMGANFSEANLQSANLQNANLTRANFRRANLNFARVSRATLLSADLTQATLCDACFEQTVCIHANFRQADLRQADFSAADLGEANLRDARLSKAIFYKADVSGANLSRVDALEANFSRANLTGVCIEDWKTNSTTHLENVICEYVYLKDHQLERRPHNSETIFAPGEFTQRFQQLLETVDLFFVDGIDWKAFLASFQELQTQYGDENLAIQGIERKGTTGFEVRLAVSQEVDKAIVELEAYQKYETNLQLLETKYRAEIQAKDKEIESHKREGANMMEITRLLASRPIHVEANAVTNDQSKSNSYNLQNPKFGGGFAAEGGSQTGGTFNDYSITLGQNMGEIDRLIATLRDMVQHFPEEQQEIAEAELIDLEEEVKTPEKQDPKRFGRRLKRLVAAGTAVATIASGAATFSGDITKFTDNVLQLTEKLGVPIEFVQTNTP